MPEKNKPTEPNILPEGSRPQSRTMHNTAKTHTLSGKAAKSSVGKKGFRFRWWYAAILVLVVAVIGISVLYFSRADQVSNIYPVDVYRYLNTYRGYQSTPVTYNYGDGSKRVDNTITLKDGTTLTGGACYPPGGGHNIDCRNSSEYYKYYIGIYHDDLNHAEWDSGQDSFASSKSFRRFHNNGGVYYSDSQGCAINFRATNTFFGGVAFDKITCPKQLDYPTDHYHDFVEFGRSNLAGTGGFTVGGLCDAARAKGYDPLPDICSIPADANLPADSVVTSTTTVTNPGGIITPPKTYTPPVCNEPSSGCDDGQWQQLPENHNFYFNARWLTEQGRNWCAVKRGDGSFETSNPSQCDQLRAQAVCAPYHAQINDALTKGDSSLLVGVPDSCIDKDIRGGINFINALKLNQTSPDGSFDQVDADCKATGWAATTNNPSQTINIAVYNGSGAGQQELTLPKLGYPANQPRELSGFKGGIFSGYHGFNYQLPDSLRDNKDHTVFIYALGKTVDGRLTGINPLLGSKTFHCDYPPRGALDTITSQMKPATQSGTFTCSASGWAADDSSLNTSITVDAYVDGNVGVAHAVPANQPRDLTSAGIPGNHAYSFDLPAKYRDASLHTLYVYGIGVGTDGKPNGVNKLIASKGFQCDLPPTGNVELVSTTASPSNPICTVTGWATDASTVFPDSVVAYYDFSPDFKTYAFLDSPYLANLPRPDVANLVPDAHGFKDRGFVYPVARQFFDGKPHKVYFYALNLDSAGTYIQQNNTFIGTKEVTCPLPVASSNTVNSGVVVSTQNQQAVGSTTVNGIDKNDNNKPVKVIKVTTPDTYNTNAVRALVEAESAKHSAKNNKSIPSSITVGLLPQTQGRDDKGELIDGTCDVAGKKVSCKAYIRPNFPTDLAPTKYVTYIDGLNPIVKSTLAEADRYINENIYNQGQHTVQVLGYNAEGKNIMGLEHKIQINNGNLSPIQQYFYAISSGNN